MTTFKLYIVCTIILRLYIVYLIGLYRVVNISRALTPPDRTTVVLWRCSALQKYWISSFSSNNCFLPHTFTYIFSRCRKMRAWEFGVADKAASKGARIVALYQFNWITNNSHYFLLYSMYGRMVWKEKYTIWILSADSLLFQGKNYSLNCFRLSGCWLWQAWPEFKGQCHGKATFPSPNLLNVSLGIINVKYIWSPNFTRIIIASSNW